MTDSQLASEIDNVVANQKLPRGLGDVYLILTPQGVGDCFDNAAGTGDCAYGSGGYCAYHSWIQTSGPVSEWTLYTVNPFADDAGCQSGEQPNKDAADDTINLISHEHNEAITDPTSGGWWEDASGEENGDLCAWDFGPGTSNQTINGNSYYLQKEWSNDQGGCVLDSTTKVGPADNALAYHGGPVMQSSATHVIFWEPPGHSSSATYQKLIAEFLGDVAADSGTKTNVYSPDQQYTGTKETYTSTFAGATVDTTPYPASFTFSAGSPGPGDVSFTASPTSDQQTSSYQWNFGDGQFGAGLQPVHHYAQGGTYTVTLVAGGASTSRSVAVPQFATATATQPTAPTTSTPTPPPGPVAAVARVLLPAQLARVSRTRAVRVRIRCATGPTCRGTLRLFSRLRVGGHRRQVLIGTARFTVASGRTASIRVVLSRLAGRALAAHRRLAVTLRAYPVGGTRVARAITLTRPAG